MIPTKEQWKAFSLLEKWGIVSAICTVLGLLFAVFIYIHPPVDPISIQEKIAKDDNKTNLTIDKIEIKNWLGDSEPYITIVIRNTSNRTALNVIPTFTSQNKAWQFKRIEAPCLIPRDLVSPNYTNEDMYVQESIGHSELVLRPETTPSTYAYMKEDISHGVVPPICYFLS